MSVILSVYAGPHDGAIAILKDGEVLVNLENERITRKKYDGGFSMAMFEQVFENANIKHSEVDFIIVDGKVRGKIPEIIKNPKGIPWDDTVQLSKQTVYKGTCEFYSRSLPLFSIHHHLSHSAGSYYTSPFEDAVIITADSGGMGFNFSTSIAQNRILKPLTFSWTTPLGWWWARLPEYYGVNNPGTLMAIGAYGRKNDLLKNELLSQMFTNSSSSITKQNIDIGRKTNEDGIPQKTLNPKIKGEADLALALQEITDNVFSGWFKQIFNKEVSQNLCFSGGLALNCISNSRAAVNAGIKKFHVPPNPNDCGIAMGAALALHHYVLKNEYKPKYFSPYKGLRYSNDKIENLLREFKKNNKLKITKTTNENIADLLSKNFIIARFFGRSEAGPRALGHRSFIASPNKKDLKNIMNKVKKREWYRPFAPIILKSEAENVLENVLNNSYYMNTSSVIKEEWRDRLSGVIHEDNSTRPQLIDKNSSKDLLEIVNIFYKKTGIPAILNTSFNVNEPLVETPQHAIETFLKLPSEVKYLQLDNFLIEKL